jgi:hypothetical protein
MATTTNYSWTTPDDTDLVKDGASAIRTLGTAIDTTTKALNPSTTLGDIEYRSSTANTNTRLALGTAGQVLTVNSGATAPEWAALPSSASITLLSTTSLTGATTTISGISGSYTNLVGIVYGITGTGNAKNRIAPNGTTTISNQKSIDGTTVEQFNGDYMFLGGSTTISSNANNTFKFQIDNYASTTTYKPIFVNGGTDDYGTISSGVIETTSAITSLVFSRSSGNLSSGTVLLYGVK